MAIVAVTPIYLRQAVQSATPLPGSNTAIDTSEFMFMTDTGRLVMGADPNHGNPNNSREYFPYAYIEVLTEFSPRMKELFQLYHRSQGITSFYFPVLIPPNSTNFQVQARSVDGGLPQDILPFENFVSTAIEYLAVTATTSIKNGVLRMLGTGSGIAFNDQSGLSSTILSFNVIYNPATGYILQADNTGSETILLYMKQTAIAVAGPPPSLEPPVWNTASGSLGVYPSGTSVSLQLSAVDPQQLSLTYFVSSGNLPTGVSLSTTGRLTGNITSSGTFTVRASDGTAYSDRSFSLTVS